MPIRNAGQPGAIKAAATTRKRLRATIGVTP
jgi:hypothetical protein